MIKRLLLLTAIFGFAVSCNDYEDDFANLNDQLNGVNAKLDNIQDAVDGIAEVQLELLNINSALAAITAAIGELPTVDDISNLSTLIGDTSDSLSDQMDDLDADLQVVATNIITQLDAMKVMIEEGFAAIDVTLSALNANIAVVDGKIVELQTSVDENGNAIDANGNAILDLAGKVEIVDGKIVAVDGKLDNMLSNLTGQLGNMIDNITAQFAVVNAGIDGVNGELDDIDVTLAANQAEALIWHMNTMAGIGRVEVDLAAIDDQNAQILQQLAGMLTVIEAGFTGMDTGFSNQSAELTATQAAILAEITIAQNGIAANLIEIQNLQTAVGILQNTIDDNQDLIEQNGLDILANGLLIDRNNNNILLNGNAIGVNGGLINDNAARIDANGDAIDGNGDKIDANGVKIDDNGVKIDDNGDGIAENGTGIDDNGNDISTNAATLLAITGLINSLQDDVDTVLENITTVYNGNLTITNDAELTYALTLQDKVAVINGDVTIDSEFTTGDTASLISVMNIFNTVTGEVEIDSSDELTANSLVSVGGNYKVDGKPVLTPSFVNAANNVTLYYSDGEDYVTSFINIGEVLTIRSNEASLVDFSNIEKVGGFSIIGSDLTNIAETNTLVNPLTANLGDISESDLSGNNPFTVNYTVVPASAVNVSTNTNLVVTGTDFAGLTLAGNDVDLSANDITDNVLVTAEGALVFSANDITNTSIILSSDGQDIDVNDVVTTTFGITDTGSTVGNFTDMAYSSVTATSFTLTSSTPGANNVLTAVEAATSAWTVDQTTMTLNKTLAWNHYTPQVDNTNHNIGYPINGDVTITVQNGGSTIISGLIDGDVDVQTNGNITLTTVNNLGTTDNNNDWIWSHEGEATLVSNIGNVTINHKLDDAADTTLTLGGLPNTGVELGERNLTATAGNITRRAGDNQSGPFNLLAGLGITFQGPSTPGFGALNITGFTTTADFQQNVTEFTDITVNGSGQLLGANLSGATYPPYTLNISADAGIILTGFDQIGTNGDGNLITSVLTSTTGDIDISNVVTISNDATISSTDGDILADALTSADGVVSITASGTGYVDTHLLATHDGSSLTIGGSSILVESLVSSTGDLTLNGDLILFGVILGTLDASPLLATWGTLTIGTDTTVQLPAHDDENAGAMTLTLAETVSTNSITIAEVSAPAMTSLELTAQSTSFALVDGDFDSAAAGYVIDITGDSTLDAMSFTSVSNLTGLTTAGNVDTFVADGNPLLATITADHVNVVGAAANPLGTKLHLIDNESLAAYESNTSKMHEIIITGNTDLETLNLQSYLAADADNDGVGEATNDDTAFDGNTVNFIFNVTNNGLEGSFTPKDNSGTPDTSLLSNDLLFSGVREIALHLLSFTQGTVDVDADFVGLTNDPDAFDTFNADTDFTNGINTTAEFTLLGEEIP